MAIDETPRSKKNKDKDKKKPAQIENRRKITTIFTKTHTPDATK
jgi:hypothetical protein